jgi:putative ABC transport system permease protein
VIGVVGDYHFRSLHEPIQPLVIFRGDGDDFSTMPPQRLPFAERLMIINVAPDGLRDTLSHIHKRFAEFDPTHPFEFAFLDEKLDRLYSSEDRLMKMMGIFAGICILVSCLGLFGLSAFATEQRTKEIGIRKVIGASAAQIVLLLSRRVLLLIAAGGVVACIGTWILTQKWLAGFAYRAPVNPSYFALAILAAAAVGLGTIALQSWRAAQADPSKALRFE